MVWHIVRPDEHRELALAAQASNYTTYRRLLHRFEIGNHNSAMKTYYQDWWRPGQPHGVDCARTERLGVADWPGAELEAKVVCQPERLFAAPCNVLSVGSNGDAGFEVDVRRRWPHCQLTTMDGTLVDSFTDGRWRNRSRLRAQLPAWLRLIPENFHPDSWTHFAGFHEMSLLKIDCEGCELDSLVPFLERVPVRQIVVEVHGCVHKAVDIKTVRSRFEAVEMWLREVDKQHHMMTGLARKGYRVFASEPNLIWSDGTCIELSLTRTDVLQAAMTASSSALGTARLHRGTQGQQQRGAANCSGGDCTRLVQDTSMDARRNQSVPSLTQVHFFFTTTPPHAKEIPRFVRSLTIQSNSKHPKQLEVLPILSIPNTFMRFNQTIDVEEEGLQVDRLPADLGPLSRYHAARHAPEDEICMVGDDDVRYPPSHIAAAVRAVKKFPHAAHAGVTETFPGLGKGPHLTGFSGVAMRCGVLQQLKLLVLPECFLADDVVVSHALNQSGVPIMSYRRAPQNTAMQHDANSIHAQHLAVGYEKGVSRTNTQCARALVAETLADRNQRPERMVRACTGFLDARPGYLCPRADQA